MVITQLIQAYDTVWREALYAKLDNLGFGGKVLKLIKSLYCNDSLNFIINGKYSSSLYLTRGVRQGNNKIHKPNTALT